MQSRSRHDKIILMKLAPLLVLVLARILSAQQFDVVIRGGLITDGTGNPAFQGDVAIDASKIAAVGFLPQASARRVIDAHGLVVAPGFIDIHNHSDYTVLKDGDAQSMVRQGVTSMILGEGGSAAPLGGKQPKGEAQDWTDFSGYFARLKKLGVSTNIGTYVGSSQVWTYVHGERAGPPSESELAQMQALVRTAMEQGALGVASSLSGPPGSWIDTNTLVAICKAAAPYGGIYSTHQRTEGKGVFESTAEAIEIGRRGGVPVDIIHLKIADHALWGKMPELVAKIEQARAAGQDITANVYPYRAGQNNLSSIIPPWAHEGGVDAMLRRLRDPRFHARLVDEIEHGIPGSDWYDHYTATGSWEGMLLVSLSNPAYKRFEGRRMNEVIRALGGDPIDVLFRVLEDNRGSVPTIYFHHDEKDMQYALRQPFVSIGSDGSAIAETGSEGHPHPRYFGTFPRVLGRYVREEKVLTLEDAVRKMTSANAVKIRQYDRGLLRSGMWADITVFDPARIIDNATWEKPRQYATGVEYVLVNGTLVLDRGKHTGARPGMILYGKGFKPENGNHTAAPEEPLPARKAAEWVIRAGGNLRIANRPGIIRSVPELPARDFQIIAVDLVGTNIEPKELWNLSGQADLRELLLPGTIFNPGAGSRLDANDQLAALASLRKLEKLWISQHFLSSINVQDKGLAQLGALDQLRELRLAQTKIKGSSLAAFKNLEALDLSETPFGDDGAQYLSGMPRLRRLLLRNTLITDAALKHIATLNNLESLDLYGTKVTDAGLQELRRLSRLRDLNILGSPVTDEGAEALAALANLEDLNLYRTQITNAGLAKLQALKKLASLDIRYTRVTSSGVEAFRAAVPGCGIEFDDLTAAGAADTALRQSMPAANNEDAVAEWITKMGGRVTRHGGHVVDVDLSRTPVSDAQAAYLASMPSVERISLAGTQISDGAVKALASLTGLHELDLSGAMVTDTGVAGLSSLSQLRVLRLNNTQVEGRGFSALASLPLLDVELSGAPVNDAGLSAITSLASLRRLRLKYTEISDAGARVLAKARNLQLLDLNSTDIGDAALKNLSGLSELAELDLSYTRITNAGLTALTNLKKLEALSAARTRITDDGAATIAQLHMLKRLNLDYTAVSDKGLKTLQAALPDVVELRLDSSGLTDASTATLGAMQNLQLLNLYHTLVTEKGYETLKQALPHCKIIFDRDSSLPNRRHS